MPQRRLQLIPKSVQNTALPARTLAILVLHGLRSARGALRVRNVLLRVPGVVWAEIVLDPGFMRVAYDAGVVDPETFPDLVARQAPGCAAQVLFVIRPQGVEESPAPPDRALPARSPVS